jgi:predicted transcriptional regulator
MPKLLDLNTSESIISTYETRNRKPAQCHCRVAEAEV